MEWRLDEEETEQPRMRTPIGARLSSSAPQLSWEQNQCVRSMEPSPTSCAALLPAFSSCILHVVLVVCLLLHNATTTTDTRGEGKTRTLHICKTEGTWKLMLMTDTAAPRDVSRSGSRLLCRPSELLFPPSCHGRRRRKDGGGREGGRERGRGRKHICEVRRSQSRRSRSQYRKFEIRSSESL